MVQIRNEAKGLVLKVTQDGETSYMYLTDLVGKIWDDYVRGIIGNVYTRGLLKDLQFMDTQIFHMLEQLQVGRREYERIDYKEVIYR